jgi:phosphatidate phosphatase APP1
VTASTGYGDVDGVHVFARVLLAPPLPSDPPPAQSTARVDVARPPRGWRSLLTLPATGIDVRVTVGGRTHVLRPERGGYVHTEVAADLVPGWHDALVEVDGRAPVACRVRVVDPASVDGVVSDIDDTVLVTSVPRPLLAAWNTFILREHARHPVPGMSDLLRTLAGTERFVVYLSTGAWNFAPHLERFMAEHGFPPGPMFLTDWGPTESGWFRSGAEHKRATLQRLRREHPRTRWILVGDDGQRDPEVYAEFATAHPDAVAAVAIRRLTAAEHVLAAGSTTAPSGEQQVDSPAVAVPWVTGADGHEILAALTAAGVLDALRVPVGDDPVSRNGTGTAQ